MSKGKHPAGCLPVGTCGSQLRRLPFARGQQPGIASGLLFPLHLDRNVSDVHHSLNEANRISPSAGSRFQRTMSAERKLHPLDEANLETGGDDTAPLEPFVLKQQV